MKLSLHPIGRLVVSSSASLLSIAALADARPIASEAQSHPGAVHTSPVRRGGEVRIVAPSGGDFTQINAAIDACAPGDTVLVKTGGYSGFTMNGKGVNVVEDTGAAVSVSEIGIGNLPPQSAAVVIGLTAVTDIHMWSNQGAVRLDSCVRPGKTLSSWSYGACDVVSSTDVVITRSTFTGHKGSAQGADGQHGLYAFASKLTLYETSSTGGRGADGYVGGDGGDGLNQSSSFLFAAGCTLRGGYGGDAFCVAGSVSGNGGDGLVSPPESIGLDTALWWGYQGLADCYESGYWGSTGAFSSALAGSAREMQLATPVRDASVTPITFVGEPGDVVSLYISRSTAHVYDADLRGVRVVDGPYSAILYMGIVPPSGTLNSVLRLDDRWTPPHTATLYFAQAVFADTGGGATLSNPVPLVVLDSVY